MTEHDPIRDYKVCPICEIAVLRAAEKLEIPMENILELIELMERTAW
jgi:hypothetical protein